MQSASWHGTVATELTKMMSNQLVTSERRDGEQSEMSHSHLKKLDGR